MGPSLSGEIHDQFQSCIYYALFWNKPDHSAFQCGNCLLAQDYSLEMASLITQVTSLRKKLGNTQSRMFTFSPPVAGRSSRLLDASPPCRYPTGLCCLELPYLIAESKDVT
jgi:hypothetical protein